MSASEGDVQPLYTWRRKPWLRNHHPQSHQNFRKDSEESFSLVWSLQMGLSWRERFSKAEAKASSVSSGGASGKGTFFFFSCCCSAKEVCPCRYQQLYQLWSLAWSLWCWLLDLLFACVDPLPESIDPSCLQSKRRRGLPLQRQTTLHQGDKVMRWLFHHPFRGPPLYRVNRRTLKTWVATKPEMVRQVWVRLTQRGGDYWA